MKKLICIASLIFAFGCEKNDEFANAPTVNASPSKEKAQPVRSEASAGRLANPNQPLPSDHPPVGSVGSPGQGMPVASAGGQADFGEQVRFSGPEQYGKTGPLLWEAPESWIAVKPASAMRLAEYQIPGPKGLEAGTMSIFHFGTRGGGGVDANLDRWIGQFKSADGGMPEAKRATETINGLKVSLVAVEGSYNAGMAGNGQTKGAQAMLGAIAESPGGLIFFKLIGPKATIDAAQKDFDAFVKSFKPNKM